MKKLILLIIPLILVVVLFAGVTLFLNQNSGKGALQVTANPKSNVYLNEKMIGQTPLCKCELPDMLAVGEYTIRLQPLDTGFATFEEKITITKSVLTVVDRTFGKDATSDGSIINLVPINNKKSVELLALSFPDKAKVYVDSTLVGQTPLLKKDLTVSDHEVRLVREGYKEKAVRIRTVPGYKLSVIAFLGIDQNQVSAKLASPSATPSPQPSSVADTEKIIILQTPTGFLRVRARNAVSSAEVGRVIPGETYELLSEVRGWFEIKLLNGNTGWVSAQYAQKQ